MKICCKYDSRIRLDDKTNYSTVHYLKMAKYGSSSMCIENGTYINA